MSDRDTLETRVSTALAARYMGVTRRHVEPLIHRGALERMGYSLARRNAGALQRAAVFGSLAAGRATPKHANREQRAADCGGRHGRQRAIIRACNRAL